MSDYLAGLQRYSFHPDTSLELKLDSGQKATAHRTADTFVSRPDKVLADIQGDRRDQRLYYDGKTVTIFIAKQKKMTGHSNEEDVGSARACAKKVLGWFNTPHIHSEPCCPPQERRN